MRSDGLRNGGLRRNTSGTFAQPEDAIDAVTDLSPSAERCLDRWFCRPVRPKAAENSEMYIRGDSVASHETATDGDNQPAAPVFMRVLRLLFNV